MYAPLALVGDCAAAATNELPLPSLGKTLSTRLWMMWSSIKAFLGSGRREVAHFGQFEFVRRCSMMQRRQNVHCKNNNHLII